MYELTNELRRMLDDRGVGWDGWTERNFDGMWIATRFTDMNGARVTAFDDGITPNFIEFYMNPTLSQVVAATLGDTDATAERRGDAGTCHMEYCDELSGDELYPTEAYECSACGGVTVEGKPDYCPYCGRKVVEL